MSKPLLFPGRIKRIGQRLLERLQAMRAFSLRRHYNVWCVKVFRFLHGS